MNEPIFLIAQRIGETQVETIRDQIAAQGHRLTGRLSASVEYQVKMVPDGLVIQFLLNEYGVPLNTGVIASRIPFGRPTGAKVSKYIQGLIRFAKLRFRVTEKEAKGIAFAIAHKHIKEGMPTRGSYRFSKTGKRTEYLEDAILQNTAQIEKFLLGLEAEIFRPLDGKTYLKLN